MYNTGQFMLNIKMEYSKEERELEIKERKMNRHKYRDNLNSMMRMSRTGRRFNAKTNEIFFKDPERL